MDSDFTRHYSLSLFVWYLQSVTVVKKYSLCFAVPAVLCWRLVIISMVKITFNLIIHLCVSCGFVHRTCQSHFAKITDLIKRLQNMSSQISPFHQPKGWLPGVGLQVTYIQVFFVVFFSMGKLYMFYNYYFTLSFFIDFYYLHILLGYVLELQTKYFWWDEEDFSGSYVFYMLCKCYGMVLNRCMKQQCEDLCWAFFKCIVYNSVNITDVNIKICSKNTTEMMQCLIK